MFGILLFHRQSARRALYSIDSDQAAARCPAAWFGVIVMVIGVLGWLDYYGYFDGLGRWLGKVLKEVRDVFSV